MKERIVENGIEYVKSGDYYFPDFEVPKSPGAIGKYGRMHGKFIKENHRSLYSAKMLDGTWLKYLYEIDATAKEMYERLISEMKIKYGITEQLKSEDQLKWIQGMENITHYADEFILIEFIYKV